MSDTLERDVDQLLNDAVAGQRSISDVRFNGENRVVAYFEDDGMPSMAKAVHGRPMLRGRNGRMPPISLPKGYVPQYGVGNFGTMLRDGMDRQDNGRKFMEKYGKSFDSLAKAVSINTTAFDDGGALVLPEFAPEIMTMLYESNSLWSRTRQYTVAGNTMSFPRLRDNDRRDGARHGGVAAYWVGETDAITESAVKFDTTDISLNKLAVAVFLTEEMLSDSGYAIEQFVTEVVQAEMDYMLDRSLIVGDGVKKPLGMLKSPARVIVSKESGQAANTVNADNILKMWGRRMDAGSNEDLVWLVNQDVETLLPKLYLSTGSSSGQLVYMTPAGFADRPYATLQGRPVINCEHCPALSSEGDIALVNLKQVISINKGPVNQLSSPHVQFLRDLMCIKFTFRVNGRPLYDRPVTMENSSNQRSPFIVLQAR